jgi:multiple sugar transport system ATP-binding protein
MNFLTGEFKQERGAGQFHAIDSGSPPANGRLSLLLDSKMSARLERWQGQKLIIGIRPEQLVCGERSLASGEPEVDALIEAVEPAGPESFLRLSAAGHSFTARAPSEGEFRANDRTWLGFRLKHAHFFDADSGKAILAD